MKGSGWIARQGQTRGGVRGCSLPGEELDISPQDEGNTGKGCGGNRAADRPLWSQRGDQSRVRETRENQEFKSHGGDGGLGWPVVPWTQV